MRAHPARVFAGRGARAVPEWLRRARPLLGTLVDIGVPMGHESALLAAFGAIERVQALMSAFDAGSDLGRAHRAPAGQPTCVHRWTAEVLVLASDLHAQSGGLFDASQGSGGWAIELHDDGGFLTRLHEGTRLDLGGVAKGWAVDQAVAAAIAAGAQAVWVNAGGDVRSQGVTVPVALRMERQGGARSWTHLRDGAIATSDFHPEARARLHGQALAGHVSVQAPCCAWADALTKIVARHGDVGAPACKALLQRYRAHAWIHHGH